MTRRDSNPQIYAIDRAATGICQSRYTASRLMELDLSGSKNSILDICRPTTSYITKKGQMNEFVTRTSEKYLYCCIHNCYNTFDVVYVICNLIVLLSQGILFHNQIHAFVRIKVQKKFCIN